MRLSQVKFLKICWAAAAAAVWFVAAGSAAVRNWQTKAQAESNLAEAWAVVSRAASLACVDKLPSQYTGKQHIAC